MAMEDIRLVSLPQQPPQPQPCHFMFLHVPPHLQCSTDTSAPPQPQHTSCSQPPIVTTTYPPVAALLQTDWSPDSGVDPSHCSSIHPPKFLSCPEDVA